MFLKSLQREYPRSFIVMFSSIDIVKTIRVWPRDVGIWLGTSAANFFGTDFRPTGANVKNNALNMIAHRCNFSKSTGSSKGEKCSRYHRNPDETDFLFRSDPFSYHHWGVQRNIGGSAQHWGGGAVPEHSQGDVKLRPCDCSYETFECTYTILSRCVHTQRYSTTRYLHKISCRPAYNGKLCCLTWPPDLIWTDLGRIGN